MKCPFLSIILIDILTFFSELYTVRPDYNYDVDILPGLLYRGTEGHIVLSCGEFKGLPDCACSFEDAVQWQVHTNSCILIKGTIWKKKINYLALIQAEYIQSGFTLEIGHQSKTDSFNLKSVSYLSFFGWCSHNKSNDWPVFFIMTDNFFLPVNDLWRQNSRANTVQCRSSEAYIADKDSEKGNSNQDITLFMKRILSPKDIDTLTTNSWNCLHSLNSLLLLFVRCLKIYNGVQMR